MRYILMHKNIQTLSFEIDSDGMAGNIENILNESHAPIYILKINFWHLTMLYVIGGKFIHSLTQTPNKSISDDETSISD